MSTALLTLLIAGTCLVSLHAQGPRLFVVNQGDKTVSVVDPATNAQVAVLDEHQTTMHGHEAAVGPDPRIVFVPIYGNVGVGAPGLDGSEMLAIDWTTGETTGTVDFGHGVRPHCAVYDKASGHLYVTTELDEAITAVDPKSLKVLYQVPTGAKESHMLAITRDGKWGYTANCGSGTVSVLDLVHRKPVTQIPISAYTQRIALSPDDKWVFTADQTTPRMAAISTATNTIEKWIDLPGNGYGSMATPNGKWLLVPIPNKDLVVAIDLKKLEVVHTIPVDKAPQEMLVRPDGKFAYVAGARSKKVSVIDLKTWQKVASIDVGDFPDGLAWSNGG